MRKTKKTVLKGFDYRQCDDFAAYLNHMARLGWHFQQWGAGLVFSRGEPEDAVYAVEVFSDGSEYDTRPEPKTEEFAEYCQAAGWKLIDAKRKFCIFKRIREDAHPIMTDEERLYHIAKAMQPEVWTALITPAMFTAMRLLDMNMFFQRYVFYDAGLLFTLFWPVLLAVVLLRCGLFYLWKYRCRQRLESGKRLFFGKGRQAFPEGWYSRLRTAILIFMLLILFLTGETWMVAFFLVFLAVLAFGAYLIARFRPDAVSNQVIQVAGSAIVTVLTFGVLLGYILIEDDSKKIDPQPPLTYADMGVSLPLEEIGYTDQLRGTLGSWEYFSVDYGTDYLFYDIYRTDHQWILDKIWEGETEGKANETREDCTSAWGAVEAFRNGAGEYIVRYANAIWVISPSLDDPLTQEQINSVISALKGD